MCAVLGTPDLAGWRDVPPQEESERNQTMNENQEKSKYVCRVCGWVYDPAENDGVAFRDLPDDWNCPVCGVRKEEFDET